MSIHNYESRKVISSQVKKNDNDSSNDTSSPEASIMISVVDRSCSSSIIITMVMENPSITPTFGP